MSRKRIKIFTEITPENEEITETLQDPLTIIQVKQEDPLKSENILKENPFESVNIKLENSFENSTVKIENNQNSEAKINQNEQKNSLLEIPSFELSQTTSTKQEKSSEIHKCLQCNEVFEYKSTLIRHKMTHIEKIKCKKCSKNVFKHMLKEHEKSHENQKDLQCEICERIFSEKSAKNRHMMT